MMKVVGRGEREKKKDEEVEEENRKRNRKNRKIDIYHHIQVLPLTWHQPPQTKRYLGHVPTPMSTIVGSIRGLAHPVFPPSAGCSTL